MSTSKGNTASKEDLGAMIVALQAEIAQLKESKEDLSNVVAYLQGEVT